MAGISVCMLLHGKNAATLADHDASPIPAPTSCCSFFTLFEFDEINTPTYMQFWECILKDISEHTQRLPLCNPDAIIAEKR